MTRSAASHAMEAYARGDDGAFERVYHELAPRLLRYLGRLARDPATAEDLLHHTFLQMHLARGDFHAGAEVEPWAFTIARRLFLNWARRLGREELRPHLDDDGARGVAPDGEATRSARETSARLEAALAELPALLRDTFLLVQDDGLTFEQAARVLGASAATLRVRYHRARERLRAVLAPEPEPAAATAGARRRP